MDWNNVVWSIWWLKQSIKPFILNESVIAITITNCVYFLSCVWVFRFLKVQKFNFSPTLALNYTKAILSRVGLTRLHQRYFLKKMLFNDVISFVWFIYISQIRNLFCWCGKVTNFFSSQLTSEKRSLFQDVTWSIFIYKSWSVNSFDFKMLLTILSLQKQSFKRVLCWF